MAVGILSGPHEYPCCTLKGILETSTFARQRFVCMECQGLSGDPEGSQSFGREVISFKGSERPHDGINVISIVHEAMMSGVRFDCRLGCVLFSYCIIHTYSSLPCVADDCRSR